MIDPNLPVDQQHIDDEVIDIDEDSFEEEEADFSGASDELGFAPDR